MRFSVLQSYWKKSIFQIRGSLWHAVTYKRFEIQSYRLVIGLEWKKIQKSSKLSCLINAIKIILNGFIKYKRYKLFFQWLSILSYAQNSGWLWRAVTSKRFKIQTWDWSRLNGNSKIFKITSTEKKFEQFFLSILSTYEEVRLFFLFAWYYVGL